MAVYKSVTCYTAGDVVMQMKSFLTSNGFSISSEAVSGGRTTWNAAKGGLTHRFMVVENSTFPLTIGNSWYRFVTSSPHTYGLSIGIRAAELASEAFFISGETPTTLRMDMFLLGSADVLFSFEIAVGKWTHLYSGTLGNRIGTWNGGRLYSGSCAPNYNASYIEFDLWYENTHAGLFNSGYHFYAYTYKSGGDTRSISYYSRGTAFLYEGGWKSLPSGIGSSSSPDNILPIGGMGSSLNARRSSSAYESTGNKYIAETSTSTYTGIPTLHPIFISGGSSWVGSVSDIYTCSGVGMTAGQELAIGAYKYRLYPHSSSSYNLFIAVRAN